MRHLASPVAPEVCRAEPPKRLKPSGARPGPASPLRALAAWVRGKGCKTWGHLALLLHASVRRHRRIEYAIGSAGRSDRSAELAGSETNIGPSAAAGIAPAWHHPAAPVDVILRRTDDPGPAGPGPPELLPRPSHRRTDSRLRGRWSRRSADRLGRGGPAGPAERCGSRVNVHYIPVFPVQSSHASLSKMSSQPARLRTPIAWWI